MREDPDWERRWAVQKLVFSKLRAHPVAWLKLSLQSKICHVGMHEVYIVPSPRDLRLSQFMHFARHCGLLLHCCMLRAPGPKEL